VAMAGYSDQKSKFDWMMCCEVITKLIFCKKIPKASEGLFDKENIVEKEIISIFSRIKSS
ncbi:hypothetical protein THOM_0874, partial [Trachipleistophora hominis]